MPPADGFLQGLREVCDKHGALLIFDEVMTGFRVAYGGAQSLYKIRPDLTCLGKVIGGGLPVGAYGGAREIMEKVSPAGPVYQAGTLSGNPLAMTAGIETLDELNRPGVWNRMGANAAALEAGLCEAAQEAGVAVQVLVPPEATGLGVQVTVPPLAGLAVVVIARAAGSTVSVSVALLLPGVVSKVPIGAAIVATLLTLVPLAAVTLAVTVIW